MKITLNLSPRSSARDRYALAWAIPATLVGLAGLILLGRASLHEYRDYVGIRHQLTEVEMRAEEFHRQEAVIRKKLEDPAYRDLLMRAKFVNKLIDQRAVSLTDLSARLAGLLPDDAHLTALALTSPKNPGDEYAVRMGITAKSEDAIESFINDLEDAPDFKDVSILNQGFQEEAAQGPQVSLVCTARYLPGAEVASEDKSQEPEVANQKSEVGSQASGAKSQKPEVANQKSDVGSQASGAKNQKTGDKTPKPAVGSQK